MLGLNIQASNITSGQQFALFASHNQVRDWLWHHSVIEDLQFIGFCLGEVDPEISISPPRSIEITCPRHT